MDPTIDRQKQSDWTGVLDRPEFVVVHRDHRACPGVLFEWRRRREPDGFQRSARVVFLDAYRILRQSWFLERFVEPASLAEPERSRPRLTQPPSVLPRSVATRPGVAG